MLYKYQLCTIWQEYDLALTSQFLQFSSHCPLFCMEIGCVNGHTICLAMDIPSLLLIPYRSTPSFNHTNNCVRWFFLQMIVASRGVQRKIFILEFSIWRPLDVPLLWMFKFFWEKASIKYKDSMSFKGCSDMTTDFGLWYSKRPVYLKIDTSVSGTIVFSTAN